jgi:hypothetical protein
MSKQKEVKKSATKKVSEIVDKGFTPRTLVSSNQYHDFNNEPIFTGRYTGSNVVREKDEINGSGKKGDIIGYIFETEDDVKVTIGNSHAVTKALELADGENPVLNIEFMGKIMLKNGKPFNKFEITQIG